MENGGDGGGILAKLRQPTPALNYSLDFSSAFTAADYCFRHASAYIRPRVSRGIKTPISKTTLLTPLTSKRAPLRGERGKRRSCSAAVTATAHDTTTAVARAKRKRQRASSSRNGSPSNYNAEGGLPINRPHSKPSFEYNNIARGFLLHRYPPPPLEEGYGRKRRRIVEVGRKGGKGSRRSLSFLM